MAAPRSPIFVSRALPSQAAEGNTPHSTVWRVLTLIPAWVSNQKNSNVWDGIIYPFPNLNGCIVDVWELISNFVPQFIMDVFAHAEIKVKNMLVKGALVYIKADWHTMNIVNRLTHLIVTDYSVSPRCRKFGYLCLWLAVIQQDWEADMDWGHYMFTWFFVRHPWLHLSAKEACHLL